MQRMKTLIFCFSLWLCLSSIAFANSVSVGVRYTRIANPNTLADSHRFTSFSSNYQKRLATGRSCHDGADASFSPDPPVLQECSHNKDSSEEDEQAKTRASVELGG